MLRKTLIHRDNTLLAIKRLVVDSPFKLLGPVEDRRRRPHKRTALAKLRDALWGGPFLCPNCCIAWMQKWRLNLALKVSNTASLIEYSSTESATFLSPSQQVMGAIFLTKKPKNTFLFSFLFI